MEGMGLKFIPVIGRHLLRHSSMFEPMTGTSGTHSYSPNSPNGAFNLPLAFYLPPPPAPPLSATHPL